MIQVDAIVVGASLAGASLALRLERQGISTLLVDSVSFPRRKACGEGLSVIGMRELDALGLGQACRALPSVPYRGFRFIEGTGRSRIELFSESSGQAHGIGIQRILLDDLIVREHARSGGVQALKCAARVTTRTDGSFSVRAGGAQYAARYLALATGGRSRLPQMMGVPTIERRASKRCGLRVDLKIPPRTSGDAQAVAILMREGVQVCCTPVEPGRLTLSFMTDQRKAAAVFKSSNLPRLLEWTTEALGTEGELCDEPLGASGIGRFQRAESHRNIFLLGDALRQLDPIGGMGMTQALVSARITAHTLDLLLHGSETERIWAERSHRTRLYRELRRLAGYTKLSYWSLVSRGWHPILGPLKTGRIAKEVLLSMHRPPSHKTLSGLASALLLKSVEFL